MYKFAHITDCHLGAWRNQKLRDLNLEVFEKAVDKCIDEKVDFIVITGDFFDINIPDLGPVKRAAEILKNIKDKGIEVYIIYGSHDFSPNTVSMIDILHSAGLFVKPIEAEEIDEKIRLKFFEDKKTGVKIAGLSGRKVGLDKKYYEMLDLQYLESQDGMKIFLFHAPISEATPQDLSHGDTIPISFLPKGFIYYGGGHLHRRIEHKFKNYDMVVYPGPLFGSSFTDLENTANGEKRGFYIIAFDNKVRDKKFVEIKVLDVIFHTIDADNLSSSKVDEKMSALLEKIDVENKIVLFKVAGKLRSGNRSDINFSKYEEALAKKGAAVYFINRAGLLSVKSSRIKVLGKTREEIESKIIDEHTRSFKIDSSVKDKKAKAIIESRFTSNGAKHTVRDLLRSLNIEKMNNESISDHQEKVLKNIKSVLKLG